jgi:hypothetical protein
MREANRPNHLHVPNVMEIWDPKPPVTVWATPGLLWDSFTFTFTFTSTFYKQLNLYKL